MTTEKSSSKINLPALNVIVNSAVTASNLPEFKAAAQLAIDSITTELNTDDDFAMAKTMVTQIKAAEDLLTAKATEIVNQSASVQEVLEAIAQIKKGFATKRLDIDKQVTKRELEIKAEEIKKAGENFAELVAELEEETKPLKLATIAPNFIEAAKGTRSITGLQKSLNAALQAGIIAANADAKDLRTKLAFCKENAEGLGGLFRDLQQLAALPMEAFKKTVTDRVEAHKKAEADRIEAEQTAAREKAEKEAAEIAEKQAETAQIAAAEPVAIPEQPKQPEAAQNIRDANGFFEPKGQTLPRSDFPELFEAVTNEHARMTGKSAAANESLESQALKDCAAFTAKYQSVTALEWVLDEMQSFINLSTERKSA